MGWPDRRFEWREWRTKVGRRLAPWRRQIAVAAVWVAAALWTAFLVVVETTDTSLSGFDRGVRIMGSAGIAYALFVVIGPPRLARPPARTPAVRDPDARARSPWAIVTLALALTAGSIVYRLTDDSTLHQTSLFFVGVPALMAITLAFTPKAKSATGTIVKGLTLALLLSGVVFAEGFVCIVMAAPLFYLIGVLVGAPIDRARRKGRGELRVYSFVGAGMLLLSLEGLTPATSFPQVETVSVTRVVDAAPADVRRTLAATPVFDEDLPLYLRIGFPRPVEAFGSGLERGDTRRIVFGDESPMEPMEATAEGSHVHAAPADGRPYLDLEVVRSRGGRVVFEPVRDATAFTHWIAWGRSVVEWRRAPEGGTEITWTLTFERKLSPAWYFAPFQRYAARQATGYLIDTVASP